MFTASWKKGFGFYDADAQSVAEEIASIGESATPKQIVEKARDESTELHKCFEWNNEVAAEKFREHQAREVVRLLVIEQTEEEKENNEPEVRFFHKTSNDEGYKQLEIIIQRPDEYRMMLSRAMSELNAFRRKYSSLSELQELFEVIDKIA